MYHGSLKISYYKLGHAGATGDTTGPTVVRRKIMNDVVCMLYSQCISMLTEARTGWLILLLEASQV
jgi:hypothetical protein